MVYVLYTVHVVISIFLILVVLLQRGKGADLSVFGGGATQAAFGARGQASLLHKLTVICFVAFILTTLSIGLFEARSRPSVMGGVDAPAEEKAEEAATPAPATPASESVPPPGEGTPPDGSAPATTPAAEEAPAPAETPATPPPSGAGSGL